MVKALRVRHNSMSKAAFISINTTCITSPYIKAKTSKFVTASYSTLLAATLLLTGCAQPNSDTETSQNLAIDKDKALQTQSIRIAAAANLSDVLPHIIEGFDKHLTDKDSPKSSIEVTYASSGKLYAQIKSGAPYDLFLSANQDFPATLAAENTSKNYGKPFTYTQGQLAVYSTTKTLEALTADTLAQQITSAGASKITIANPELAPYGESAKAYLQSYNLYDTLIAQKRLIQAENIGQAFQYAHTGSVDYGFVAQSQLIAIKASPKHFYTLPIAAYPAILQDGIVISAAPTAASFADYLQSPSAQQYFTQAGYLAVR